MAKDDINPTRMELINVKKRIKLAQKGHGLLKKKRDALIIEFFRILKKAKDLRSVLNRVVLEAYGHMLTAEMSYDKVRIDSLIAAAERHASVGAESRNIMGLRIPRIIVGEQADDYVPDVPSPSLQESGKKFREALRMVIEVAETETALKRLIREIEKTKRRVNALEFIVIPDLHKQAKSIAFRLEEMERDTFIMLKTLKRKSEKKKEEGG